MMLLRRSLLASLSALAVASAACASPSGATGDAETSEEGLTAGAPYASFGDAGTANLPIERAASVEFAFESQSDRVVLLVREYGPERHRLLAVRKSSGAVDTTFGENGFVTLPAGTSAHVLHELSDGSILLEGGYRGGEHSPSTKVFSRLHPDGSLDTTFGTGGSLRTDESVLRARALATAVDPGPNGGIYVEGVESTGGARIDRFDLHGKPDASAAGAGLYTSEMLGAPRAQDMFEGPVVLTFEGGYLYSGGPEAASFTFNGPPTESRPWPVRRFVATGLDASWGAGGTVQMGALVDALVTPPPVFSTYGAALTGFGKGKLLVRLNENRFILDAAGKLLVAENDRGGHRFELFDFDPATVQFYRAKSYNRGRWDKPFYPTSFSLEARPLAGPVEASYFALSMPGDEVRTGGPRDPANPMFLRSARFQSAGVEGTSAAYVVSSVWEASFDETTLPATLESEKTWWRLSKFRKPAAVTP